MSVGPEIDPSRRMGQPPSPTGLWGRIQNAGKPLNPDVYSGTTAMNPPSIPGKGINAQTVASGNLVYNGQQGGKPQFMDAGQARNSWMFLPDETQAKFNAIMDDAFEGKWTNGQAQHYVNQAVSGANYALYANDQYVTWLDVLPMVVGRAKQDRAAKAGGGGTGGPSTTTQVRLSDPQTAQAILDDALAKSLGRQATAAEAARFRRTLNRMEAKNPTVTRSMRTGAGASVVTTGGFNPSTFAQEYAQGMQGSAEFQAATTFLDAFMNALKPVVS